MNRLKLLLEQMGLLHDSVVQKLVWEPSANTLRFEIEDLYSNFEGFPEYPGITPGSIELLGVVQVWFDIETSEKRLHIHEFIAGTENEDLYRIAISFWPAGKITVLCHSACFPDSLHPYYRRFQP